MNTDGREDAKTVEGKEVLYWQGEVRNVKSLYLLTSGPTG